MTNVISLPVPALSEPEPGPGSDGTPITADDFAVRLERAARAVDECAALSEDLIRVLRGLRADLMAGREPDIQVVALSLITHLAGSASALGETHVELDEMTNQINGGGVA